MEVEAAKSHEAEQPGRILLPVIALPCDIPLFFRGYKPVCGPNDAALPPTEAAGQVAYALARS